MLLSLTYFSSATRLFDPNRLPDLLAEIREQNRAADLTGMLIYHEGSFVQAIEGPQEAVRAAFARIEVDPRHRGIFVAFEELVTERSFPDWAMSFRDLSGFGVDQLEGFSTFLQDVRKGREVTGDSAPHHLLRAFSRPRI